MPPEANRLIFFVFLTSILILFVAGIVYLIGLAVSATPNVTIDAGNGFTCSKLGINCEKILSRPSSEDRLLALLVGKTWFHHVSVSSLFILFGFLAYLCRCRAQLLYGCVEVFAALVFAATFLYSINVQNFRLFSATVGLLAALYVIVRGLDNIEKGLTDLPELHQRWRSIWFGSRASK